MPQLSEGWAAVYLHVIVIMMVFTLGIPTMIFELTVPSEVRTIIHRSTKKRNAFVYGTTLLLFATACALVWGLHPCPGSIASEWEAMASGGLISVSLATVILLCFYQFKNSVRVEAVEWLRKAIIGRFMRSKRGILDRGLIEDLEYLGVTGKAGDETGIVLIAMADIVERVQEMSAYDGDKLLNLIGFFGSVARRSNGASDENCYQIVDVLEKVWMRCQGLRAERRCILDGDEIAAVAALRDVALAAIDSRQEPVCRKILESAIRSSNLQLEIGRYALEAGCYLAAMHAVNRLVGMAEDASFLNERWNADLLALLSEFHRAEGSVAEAATQNVMYVQLALRKEFKSAIEAAIEYQRTGEEYRAVDALRAWLRDGSIKHA